MRIGIDFRVAVPQPTGVEGYVLNLTRALLQIDERNTYVLFGDPDLIRALLPGHPHLEIVPLFLRDQLGEFRWEHFGIPLAVRRYRLDVFHRPNDVGACLLPLAAPLVVTVHDVIPLVYSPTYFRGSLHALYYRLKLALMKRRAACIITDSQHSRHDLEKLGGIPGERIRVVFPGIDDRFLRDWVTEGTERAVLAKYGLADRPYCLTMGANEQRKNVEMVIRSFLHLSQEEGLPQMLAVVGKPHPQSVHSLEAVVQEAGLTDRVVFLGYVEQADMPLLYRRADCFLYLSLYEGFGLPVLEAMSCGTPVLAANASSLPEVAGDAAVLVDPEDPRAVATAMLQVLRDETIRQRLIGRGVAHARSFSYRETARQTLAIYQAVAGAGPPSPDL